MTDKPLLYKLDETTFQIKGNAAGFLNGITSNTLEAPLNAFLNQHGRIIATFRQKRVSDEEFFISVPTIAEENLFKHLERYRKLSHVSIILSDQYACVNLSNGQIQWAQGLFQNTVSEEEFTLFRLNHHIPLMGIDYQADEFILNVHEYHYVSYTKGCYLGQEPVAKVHNRSKPSRKLMVVNETACQSQEAAQMTSKIYDPKCQCYKGFVFVNNKVA